MKIVQELEHKTQENQRHVLDVQIKLYAQVERGKRRIQVIYNFDVLSNLAL